MMTEKVESRLNQHLNLEFASAHLYLSMSAYFESVDLDGFANWMFVQHQEEIAHTMKFFRYINDRDGRVRLSDVPRPEQEWESPVDVFQSVLAHEQGISAAINSLVELSTDEKDFATQNFLQWFVSEQVEEEATARAILKKIEMIGDSKEGLYMLDKELAARAFNPPSDG